MTRIDTVDEDGLTPLEQAIAKRLYDRWADGFGNLTIQEDPRNVALWLRDLVQEAQAGAYLEGLAAGHECTGTAARPDCIEKNPYR